MSQRQGSFVLDLFFKAGSPYVNDARDRTKPNRLISGVDRVNADMIRTFPDVGDERIEEVTLFFAESHITNRNFDKFLSEFGINAERKSINALGYALAKEFFAIIRSAEADSDYGMEMTGWYADCISEPLIFRNAFNEDFQRTLYLESGGKCPITGKTLNDKNTEIIVIYQKGLPKTIKDKIFEEFGEREPQSELAVSNCLAVHRDFAKQYGSFGCQDYEKIKSAMLAKRNIRSRSNASSSEVILVESGQIRHLIEKISTSSLSEPSRYGNELNYDPADISAKIGDDKFLVENVISTSSMYFKKIKYWFLLQEDALGKPVIQNILESVKGRYEQLSSLGLDKRKIVEIMSEWIMTECGHPANDDEYKRPSYVLVCFFIQDCEVFKK